MYIKPEMKLFKAFKKGFDKSAENAQINGIGVNVGSCKYEDGKFEIISSEGEEPISIDAKELEAEIREVNRRMQIYAGFVKLCTTMTEVAIRAEMGDFDKPNSSDDISLN